ncbi:MAG: chemotaxis protein CheW [Gammaproteobacteria bacterium]|nr:chemotaxis protein CheW [Gammaproteobacteria bacterium]
MAAQDTSELACVLIPLAEKHLLLPSVTVAEIAPWRRVRKQPETPDWLLGMLGWRGENIPVLQFELMNGAPAGTPIKPGRCLIIMNRTRHRGGRAFYALAAAGLPRIVHLTDEDVTNLPVRLGPAETATVRLGTENAVVPNLSYVEEQLATIR